MNLPVDPPERSPQPLKSSASDRSASELLALLSRGELSSCQLLAHYKVRFQRFNPQLNAVVASWWDEAELRAKEADQARQRGESWGPLHGLPMTIKETFEYAGHLTTAGDSQWQYHQSQQHADLVERLTEAGAIIFGKTNIPRLASDWQSFNRIYGTSNNPWNTACTPGGSSGGAAAALAADLTPIELGSDLAGSIRIPAHYCGVFGHKPSHGLLSLRGHMPGPPGTCSTPDLAVAGPLARSADDLDLLLTVLAGGNQPDSATWQPRLMPPSAEVLSSPRVFWQLEDNVAHLDTELREIYQQLQLQTRGRFTYLDNPLPAELQGESVIPLYMQLLGGLLSPTLPARERQAYRILGWLERLLRPFPHRMKLPRYFHRFIAGLFDSHASWLTANEQREQLRYTALRFFESTDVILAPVTPTAAQPHNQIPFAKRVVHINGEAEPYFHTCHWIALASLLGLPSTVAPIGMTRAGLPVGIQVIGGPGQDRTTIQVAKQLHQLSGFQEKPRLS